MPAVELALINQLGRARTRARQVDVRLLTVLDLDSMLMVHVAQGWGNFFPA